MSNHKTDTKTTDKATNAPRGGNPGDGAGRSGQTGTSDAGVWPRSGPDNAGATPQGMASFGQGERGAKGYQDSGKSEIRTMPPDAGTGEAGEESESGGAS